MEWIFYWVVVPMVKIIPVLAILPITVAMATYAERKLIAFAQVRIGPRRVGWEGLGQPFADVIKLLCKEDIVPSGANRFIFILAPMVVFASALAAYVVIPFGPGLIVQDLNIGILYIIAISSLAVLGIIMAGWSSNNKYAALGALRSAAQAVSYEVPLVISLLGPILLVALSA